MPASERSPILAVAAWLFVVHTGAYNIAAVDRHADIVRWTFDTTIHNSVRSRAGDIPEPEVVSPEAVSSGAETYASTCSHCRGAPGRDRPHWATNMRPQPPDLTEAANGRVSGGGHHGGPSHQSH